MQMAVHLCIVSGISSFRKVDVLISLGAPECYDFDLEGKRVPVSRTYDIWSLGCVLSEMATWLVFGFSGIRQFELYLSAASPGTGADGHSVLASFHDGKKVLPEVMKWHTFLRRRTHAKDHITGKILDLVDNHMLQSDPASRFDSKELCEYLCHIFLNEQGRSHALEMLASPERQMDTDKQLSTFSGGRDVSGDIKNISQSPTTDRLRTSSPVTFNGIGGMGKTQMALEWAHSHRSSYSDIFWIPANMPQALNGKAQVEVTPKPTSTLTSSLRASNNHLEPDNPHEMIRCVGLLF